MGCPKFFLYHPGAGIEEYRERFGCSHDQAVEEIRSFGFDRQREREILGGFSGNDAGFRNGIDGMLVTQENVPKHSGTAPQDYQPRPAPENPAHPAGDVPGTRERMIYVMNAMEILSNPRYMDGLSEEKKQEVIRSLYKYLDMEASGKTEYLDTEDEDEKKERRKLTRKEIEKLKAILISLKPEGSISSEPFLRKGFDSGFWPF